MSVYLPLLSIISPEMSVQFFIGADRLTAQAKGPNNQNGGTKKYRFNITQLLRLLASP
jgi:hypothetical protein